MSRLARSIASSLAVVTGLACSGCSGGPPPPALARVTVSTPAPHETAMEELQRGRAGARRILADGRDAYLVAVGQEAELPLALVGRAHLTSACALHVVTAPEHAPAGTITFELSLASKRGRELLVTSERPLREALLGWSPLTADFDAGGDPDARLVVASRFKGGDADSVAGLQAAFELPSVGSGKSTHPNVLLISVDTLRPDHLGCYGYARPTSPAIDALAARGVLFEDALSSAPWTLPSYGSLFTSLHPAQHRAGVTTEREEFWPSTRLSTSKVAERLRDDVPTLAELFQRGGWRTAGFIANQYVAAPTGLDRGFEQYAFYQYNAGVGVELATQWIDAHAQVPWFVFLHLIDPHMPYAPPAPWDERFAGRSITDIPDYPPALDGLRTAGASEDERKLLTDLYDGEVAYTDSEIGRMLAQLAHDGALENTIIVFHSDHGEEFWDHGSCDHGHTQHRELLHVPLVIAWPAHIPAAKRIGARVRALDVLPTLCELAGLTPPKGIVGMSLMPLVRGDDAAPRDALSESILWGPYEIKTFARGTHKLMSGGGREIVFGDLEEQTPIPPGDVDAKELEAWRNALLEHHRAAQASLTTRKALQMTAEEQARLKHLGYAGNGDDDESHATPPKQSSPPQQSSSPKK